MSTDALRELAALVDKAAALHQRIGAALTPPTPTLATPPEQDEPARPRVAPTAARTRWRPTAEQEAIVAAAADGQNLAVTAGAGTGKTATVELIANALHGRRGLYVVFGRDASRQAQARMPADTTVTTSHALAYHALGHRYQRRLDAPRVRADGVAQILGIREGLSLEAMYLPPSALAVQARATVTRFCYSPDPQLDVRHVPRVPGLDTPQARQALAEAVLPWARRLWEDLQDPDSPTGLRLTHDHYLKMWILSQPALDCDWFALDEAQDTNPAVAAFLRGQNAQQIVVGDPAQAIYGWRGGSADIMRTWTVDQRLQLSESWRFGPCIADEANTVLKTLGEPLRLVGNPGRDSALGPIEKPDAILSRTNVSAMAQAMNQLDQGRGVAFAGAERVRALARAARSLQHGYRADLPELVAFKNWRQVRDYVDQEPDEAAELTSLVRLVDQHGVTTILDATRHMSTEERAEVVCATMHQAKGREWDTVRLDDDLREPAPLADGSPAPIPASEARLAYVALTRARYRLDKAGLSWIRHRSTGHPKQTGPKAKTIRAGGRRADRREYDKIQRLRAWPPLDLERSYTTTIPGGEEEVTLTPKVKTRTTRDGMTLTSVSHIIPLLAHKIEAIHNKNDRLHTLLILSGADIVIADQPRVFDPMFEISTRDGGRLSTTYVGTPYLKVATVLDLAELLRAHLYRQDLVPVPDEASPTVRREAPLPVPDTLPSGAGDYTRTDLEEDIDRYLRAGDIDDIDPAAVAEAVVRRYGLIRWGDLDQSAVTMALMRG